MQQLSPRQLADLLQRRELDLQLVDVREPWEFAICRIDGAELLPMRQVPSALDRIDTARPVVVICHHGVRSQQVARYLEQQGFADVRNLQGGVDRWAQEVDPTMPTY